MLGDFVRDPKFPKTSTEDLYVKTKLYSRSADGELIEIEMGDVAYRIANGPQTERWAAGNSNFKIKDSMKMINREGCERIAAISTEIGTIDFTR